MEQLIEFHDDDEAQVVLGIQDCNLRRIREGFDVEAHARGRSLQISGDSAQVNFAVSAVESLVAAHRSEGELNLDEILDGALMSADSVEEEPRPAPTPRKGPIARSPGQQLYLDAMSRSPIVGVLGPAGTGKTYLAVHRGVEYLKQGLVRKMVLCRPAVEAGEKLGFLPGDFQKKVNPYLRPLYDALGELLDYDQIRRYSDREIIEVVPLAYMRGRTLNEAFIILDEAQNTTPAQMKMFLTRMGQESRIVVTADPTQVDLPRGGPSGVHHARRILGNIEGFEWLELDRSDIQRNSLVTKIVRAYESHEGSQKKKPTQPPRGQTR